LGIFQRNISINPKSPANNTRMTTTSNQGYARASELSDFARCQYIRTSLQSLSSFSDVRKNNVKFWVLRRRKDFGAIKKNDGQSSKSYEIYFGKRRRRI
jgi:hypothetical protein